MTDIVIFGNGEFAKLLYPYFISNNSYRICAFTVEKEYIVETSLNGIPVIPYDEIEKKFPPEKYKMFIAIGSSNMNSLRFEKYISSKEKGYKFISFIHSSSQISDPVKIGENTFIFENVVIQPNVTIGNGVIILSSCVISHNSVIGDWSFIASHSCIAGRSVIGKFCFLGIHSMIRNDVILSDNTFVGMGTAIVKDTEKNSMYLGIPGKKVGTSDNVKN